MATMQQITEKLQHIPPIIDIHNPVFEEHYKRGLYWYLFEQNELASPLSDEDIVETLQSFAATSSFDGHNNQDINERIGAYSGMLHAAVLSPDGTVKPHVTSLVAFTHPEAQRLYSIARECNFITPIRPMPEISDSELLRYITDLVLGEDWEQTESRHILSKMEWYANIGDIIGILSVHLFPWTPEDAQAARERMKSFEARNGYFPDAHNPDTDFYTLLYYEVEAVAI